MTRPLSSPAERIPRDMKPFVFHRGYSVVVRWTLHYKHDETEEAQLYRVAMTLLLDCARRIAHGRQIQRFISIPAELKSKGDPLGQRGYVAVNFYGWADV